MSDTNEFRHALRRERMARGLSQDALGAEIHVSGSQIGNYESGKSVPPEDLVIALDRIFDTGDELCRLANSARGEVVAPWLRPWTENERRAVVIRTFQPSLVPGLLQTEAYARAVISAGPHSADQVEEAVRIRMARQAATLDRADPVVLTALIGEPALHHGSATLMKEQLEHLGDIGHRPNVHIRVVPVTAGLHAGLAGAFAIATLPSGAPVLYLDDLVEGKVGAEMRDVRHAMIVWESLCGLALTCEASRDLIQKAIDSHDERAELAQEHPQ